MGVATFKPSIEMIKKLEENASKLNEKTMQETIEYWKKASAFVGHGVGRSGKCVDQLAYYVNSIGQELLEKEKNFPKFYVVDEASFPGINRLHSENPNSHLEIILSTGSGNSPSVLDAAKEIAFRFSEIPHHTTLFTSNKGEETKNSTLNILKNGLEENYTVIYIPGRSKESKNSLKIEDSNGVMGDLYELLGLYVSEHMFAKLGFETKKSLCKTIKEDLEKTNKKIRSVDETIYTEYIKRLTSRSAAFYGGVHSAKKVAAMAVNRIAHVRNAANRGLTFTIGDPSAPKEIYQDLVTLFSESGQTIRINDWAKKAKTNEVYSVCGKADSKLASNTKSFILPTTKTEEGLLFGGSKVTGFYREASIFGSIIATDTLKSMQDEGLEVSEKMLKAYHASME